MHKKLTLLALLKDRSFALFSKIDLDRVVLLGILSKLWSIIVGPVSVLVVAHKFSPQLQGYYFTFMSIIAFQFMIELGLGNIIIQFASHEWSKLSFDDNGQIIGSQDSLSRLQSLAQIFFRWYCIASIILTLSLAIGGYFFFSKNQDSNIKWLLPWFALCICNGVIFCLVPIWSLLEGCNQLLKLYSYRFIQGIFLSLSVWIAILLGAQLWTIAISNVVIIICAGLFLKCKCGTFLRTLLFLPPKGPCIKWKQEVLPLQWRTAITWIIGSFSYTLFVPVLFKYHGSVIAGQMGMTWGLVSVLISMVYSWISPKVPQFGILIAKKQYKELDNLLWRTIKIVISVAMAGAVVICFAVYALNKIGHPLATRFLPLSTVEIFILAQIILIISLPFSTYLRAHKKEPLLYVSVASGIFIVLSNLILGKYYSAFGMAIGYLLVNLVLVSIVIIIWYRCRIEWHKDEYTEAIILDNCIKINKV